MSTIDKPGIYTISATTYHAGPCPEPELSASIIRLLLSRSALHAKLAHPKLSGVTRESPTEESDCGTAAHALLLEGEDAIEVIDAPDWRTKDARERRDSARAGGRIPLLPERADAVYQMVESLRMELADHQARDAFTNGKPEQTLIWREDDVWCKARVDWLPDDHTAYVDDYKTTAICDPEQWERRMWTGYDIQAAFYLRGLEKITGKKAAGFRFIVQETEAPFLVNVFEHDGMGLEYANRKIDRALAIWRECRRTGIWPGYPKFVCHVQMPPWAAMKWDAREVRDEYLAEHGEAA